MKRVENVTEGLMWIGKKEMSGICNDTAVNTRAIGQRGRNAWRIFQKTISCKHARWQRRQARNCVGWQVCVVIRQGKICRWKDGGRRRWQNVEAVVTSCVVRSVQKCGFVWGTNKEVRTKIHLSFIYKIAIAVHYSLPFCLNRFPYGHACIPFPSPRCLCITHSARHLQYERAIVVCYITDDSWR
jgi:hypothetical protein